MPFLHAFYLKYGNCFGICVFTVVFCDYFSYLCARNYIAILKQLFQHIMIMKKLLTFVVALMLTAFASAQNAAPSAPDITPKLEYVLELKVKIDGAFSVGKTPHGGRTIIPITGGTFEGPNIKGTIIPGGADYQMSGEVQGRTEVEAIYCIKTDDGVNIHVRNCGLICSGQGGFYFVTSPKFEAPIDSKYAWLNNAVYVCKPDFGQHDYLSLKVWKVN